MSAGVGSVADTRGEFADPVAREVFPAAGRAGVGGRGPRAAPGDDVRLKAPRRRLRKSGGEAAHRFRVVQVHLLLAGAVLQIVRIGTVEFGAEFLQRGAAAQSGQLLLDGRLPSKLDRTT